jgi:uncharacterized protein (TIGR02246 family)
MRSSSQPLANASTPSSHPAEAEPVSRVHQAVLDMSEAFQRGDIPAVLRHYEEGALVVFEPGQAARGRQALKEGFEAMAALAPVFEYQGHEVQLAGDLALHIAPWTMRAQAEDGSALEERGLSVAVFRRQADGDWRMAIDHPHGAHLLQAH